MLRIRTGSRLHFGLFSLGAAPRLFGGVGLMIDEPGIQLCATPAREWSAEGPLSARVLEFARRFALRLQLAREGDRAERARFDAEVVHAGRLRDFFGFNRAKHAVVEAAILATRTAFLPLEEIEAEYRKLAVLVDKTGGAQEHEAFDLLRALG